MYLYVERDFVIGISYTGIQWLYLIIKVRSYEVFVMWWCEYSGDESEKCFYFLSYTIQQDKNPLDTRQSFIQLKETKTKLSSRQQEDLKLKLKKKKKQFEKKNKTKNKTCISTYTTAPNGLVANGYKLSKSHRG